MSYADLSPGLMGRCQFPCLNRRAGFRRREELQFLLTQARVEEGLGERACAFDTLMRAHAAHFAVDPGDAGIAAIFEALQRLAVTPEQRVDVDTMRAADFINEGRHADAEALARRTLASAGRLNYEKGSASSMSTLSMALSMQGRLAEALAIVEEFWPLVAAGMARSAIAAICWYRRNTGC